MSETVAMEVATEASPAKPGKKVGAKGKPKAANKPRAKPSHPKTAEMVTAAIRNLKERSGSSLQAIKKYIIANYKVDGDKLAPFIRKYLKAAVTSGSLVQTKGKGASGSFKLKVGGEKGSGTGKKGKGTTGGGEKVKGKSALSSGKKKESSGKREKVVAKKSEGKAKIKGEKGNVGGASKSKKTTKVPTKKPKAPKPKKVSKAKSAKKAAPKKK